MREGCRKPRGEQMLAEGGEARSSYLWGSEEGRRGFTEDSYKAIGTHKIRHFQLHRVRPGFRKENVKQKLRQDRGRGILK